MDNAEAPLWKKYGYHLQYNLIKRMRTRPLTISERRLAEAMLLAEKEQILQRLNEIEGALIAVQSFPNKVSDP